MVMRNVIVSATLLLSFISNVQASLQDQLAERVHEMWRLPRVDLDSTVHGKGRPAMIMALSIESCMDSTCCSPPARSASSSSSAAARRLRPERDDGLKKVLESSRPMAIKKAAEIWKTIPPAKREPYDDEAKKLKEEYWAYRKSAEGQSALKAHKTKVEPFKQAKLANTTAAVAKVVKPEKLKRPLTAYWLWLKGHLDRIDQLTAEFEKMKLEEKKGKGKTQKSNKAGKAKTNTVQKAAKPVCVEATKTLPETTSRPVAAPAF
eukprot:gnl/TRDRNA2_/TRDRNA2_201913_c0_seq1.p1 gnl/TRDRNA2_/TRDRNA2_201913_c0~~gnl/TRDRNA2_/TRDRNA2_201913_c0_seq1.p1  ORF type:complete len:263 (-),score=55.37 gnl/TRDRNA2_/TRDRNA2_201913_c0_seq1:229-1017(-)